MNQERHDNCWVMRGAIYAFFAFCLLPFLSLLAGRQNDSTPGNYCCCLFPLLYVFLWMYLLISVVIINWTEKGQEWTWCCSRMDIGVCLWRLVSACSSSWYVLYLFVTTGWIFEISLLCANPIQLNSSTIQVHIGQRCRSNALRRFMVNVNLMRYARHLCSLPQ